MPVIATLRLDEACALSSCLEPPASDGDYRPDRFDDSEGPRTLQESVNRAQYTGAGKTNDVSRVAILERVEDQHRGHCEQAKECERIHGVILYRNLCRGPRGFP